MNSRRTASSGCPAADHVLSRRLFLGTGAAGSAIGFGSLFSPARAAEAARNQKHVILVWLGGAPSQFETWDPKLGRPTSGPHLTIPTSIPGVHFDEFMPGLARLANRMVTIRSMTHETAAHDPARQWMQLFQKPGKPAVRYPHFLSVLAHQRPSADPLIPSLVRVGEPSRGLDAVPLDASFLGPRCDGVLCEGNGRGPVDLPSALRSRDLERIKRREAFRQTISDRFASGRRPESIRMHDHAYQSLVNVVENRSLYDLSKESPEDHERYGLGPFGRDCLLARRLVENGVPFVRVQSPQNTWDLHDDAFEQQRYLTTEMDRGVSSLVDDLVDRGLWDHTLLIVMGEFGRTPRISRGDNPGRDHWSKSFSLAMGGCGLKSGVVLGATDENGAEVADRPVTPWDLFATIYTAIGIDPRTELRFENRPLPLVEDGLGEPVAEVLS